MCPIPTCHPIINQAKDKYCVKCGAILVERSMCKNCNTELHESDNFCGSCGLSTKVTT